MWIGCGLQENIHVFDAKSLFYVVADRFIASEQFGFLHGAYFEGQMVGTQIAACLNRDKKGCHAEQSYSTLHAAGRYADYTPENGWYISSFDAAELV
jgi:hypothetical protein